MKFSSGVWDGGTVEISISTRPNIGSALAGAGAALGGAGGIGGAISGVGRAVSAVSQIASGGDLGIVNGIESVSFGHSLEVTKVKGSGQVDRGYTQGIIKTDNATIEMHADELFAWIDGVGGVKAFHNSEFDVTITYRLDGEPLNKIVLSRCRAIKVGTSQTMSSSEALTATVEIAVLGIQYNNSPLSSLIELGSNIVNTIGSIGNLL